MVAKWAGRRGDGKRRLAELDEACRDEGEQHRLNTI